MDIFLVLLYVILQVAIVLICYNIMFLGEYSTIFLFSGWLVTVSLVGIFCLSEDKRNSLGVVEI